MGVLKVFGFGVLGWVWVFEVCAGYSSSGLWIPAQVKGFKKLVIRTVRIDDGDLKGASYDRALHLLRKEDAGNSPDD